MSVQKKNTEIVLEGRGKFILRPNDYVATGGEGTIYRIGNTIIKLYTDSKKCAKEDMRTKLELLSKLRHPFIVAPEGLVNTVHGEPIGFYMPYAEGEPFSRVFTNDFRNRIGFTDRKVSVLVRHMQETVEAAHDHQAIMVDANEFNWLAFFLGNNDPEPRVIDVDSWAIGRWKASVIMPSIRDWHATSFDEQTDWFAWGIVSFQLYTGIHPYKGTLDGFKTGDLEARMKARASVFRKEVRLNRAVRDFSLIPGPLLDWYIGTFEHGERVNPPSPFATGMPKTSVFRVVRTITTASGILVYEKLLSIPGDRAIRVFPCGIVLLRSGGLVNLLTKREIGRAHSHACEVARVKDGWLKGDVVNGNITFSHINDRSLVETPLELTVKCETLVRYANRMFVVTDGGLTEIQYTFLGKPLISLAHTWGVMVHATRWFDGVGIQDALGAKYLITPFDDSCAHVRARELDCLVPVFARAGHRFVTVIASDQRGEYHKLEFSFEEDYSRYNVWRGKTDVPDVNVAPLPKGVCATIVEDGKLIIHVPQTGATTEISDKDITTDMELSCWDNKVVYIRNGDVWHVRMR